MKFIFSLAFSHSLEFCVSVDHLCFSWNHTMASGHCLLFVCLFAYSLRMSIFLRFFADDKEIHFEFRYISMCTLCGVCVRAVARCKALALTSFCSFHCWFFAHSHTLDAYVCITWNESTYKFPIKFSLMTFVDGLSVCVCVHVYTYNVQDLRRGRLWLLWMIAKDTKSVYVYIKLMKGMNSSSSSTTSGTSEWKQRLQIVWNIS